jgi:hypothetical protein
MKIFITLNDSGVDSAGDQPLARIARQACSQRSVGERTSK